MLRPGQAIYSALKRTFDFKGRSRRSEFWWFNAFLILGLTCLAMGEVYILPADPNIDSWGNPTLGGFEAWLNSWKYYGLSTAISYLTLPAFASVAMRRLHDVGRRGWPVIILVIASEISNILVISKNSYNGYGSADPLVTPSSISYWDFVSPYFVVSALIYLAFALYVILAALRDSHPGDNVYGPSPKYDSGVSVFD